MLPSRRGAKDGVKQSKTKETRGSDATFRASCDRWSEAEEFGKAHSHFNQSNNKDSYIRTVTLFKSESFLDC